VSDRYQNEGLGYELTRRLVDVARSEKIKRVLAIISPDNKGMIEICRKIGFTSLDVNPKSGMVESEISL
jgi:acetyltransferase